MVFVRDLGQVSLVIANAEGQDRELRSWKCACAEACACGSSTCMRRMMRQTDNMCNAWVWVGGVLLQGLVCVCHPQWSRISLMPNAFSTRY